MEYEFHLILTQTFSYLKPPAILYARLAELYIHATEAIREKFLEWEEVPKRASLRGDTPRKSIQ